MQTEASRSRFHNYIAQLKRFAFTYRLGASFSIPVPPPAQPLAGASKSSTPTIHQAPQHSRTCLALVLAASAKASATHLQLMMVLQRLIKVL